MDKPRILLVDDDKNTADGLKKILLQDGYDTGCTYTGKEALDLIEAEHFDIVITDMKLPDISGFSIIEKVKKKNVDIAVVMITAFSSIQTAIDAMKKFYIKCTCWNSYTIGWRNSLSWREHHRIPCTQDCQKRAGSGS